MRMSCDRLFPTKVMMMLWIGKECCSFCGDEFCVMPIRNFLRQEIFSTGFALFRTSYMKFMACF